MPADSMPDFWKQRKQAILEKPETRKSTKTQKAAASYLVPMKKNAAATNDYHYIFPGKNNDKLAAGQYSFEEAFWFVPDFLEYVEYTLDPVTKEVKIIPPNSAAPRKTGADKIEFIFEKVLFNLVPNKGQVLSPITEHACISDSESPDAAAMTACCNCPIPLVNSDDHFLLFYLKDDQKIYRTDVSYDYEVMFNNYLIPTLSSDMSIWWYKIPNPFIDSDEQAQLVAEEALQIWHIDRENYLKSLPLFPHLTSTHYVGVYQRSYFCDELQMRFTNMARIGNDHTLPLEFGIREFSGILYQPLKIDLMG